MRGDRRRHRRRLLIYRPSPDDWQTPPTLQKKEVTPDTKPPLQTSASGYHGRALQHNPSVKSTPSREQARVHQREPLIRTNRSTDRGNVSLNEHLLQTPLSRDLKEKAQHGAPLQTPSSVHKEMVLRGAPLQTPSSSDHKEMVQHGAPLQTPSSSDLKEMVQRRAPLQTSSSSDHKEMVQHGALLQTPYSSDHKEMVHCGAPLQTPSSIDLKEMVHCGAPLQTPSSSDHKETVQRGAPLQTPSSRHWEKSQHGHRIQTPRFSDKEIAYRGSPIQTPSSRNHRAIIQHGTQFQTTPSRYRRPWNEHCACLLASPLERTANRVLFVELHDVSCQVRTQSPPTDRTPVTGDCSVLSSVSSQSHCDVQDVPVLPKSTELPPDLLPCSPSSPSPPLLSPPVKVPGWGLGPLFQSVRTKLESFAEIFFSPKKSHRGTQNEQVVEQPQSPSVSPGEENYAAGGENSAVHPSSSSSDTPSEMQAEDNQNSLPPASSTDMNLQLKIEISSPVSTLCRPPLQRCLSCPLLPHRPRRFSLETAEPDVPVCSCRAKISRKRRHSVGTIEEFRNLQLSPTSLTCLRKEKHPSALWTNCQPETVLQYAISSPPGRCLDGVRETERSSGGADSAEESNPLSQCKEIKERKVSNIQIRKRVARQEGTLTPMGLPKRLRLQKDDFSLEEIYTNKNYHTPTEKRKFETIFEEPVMKGGTLILTSQRPLRRIMVFKNSSAPRRKKKKGRGGGRTRSCVDNKGSVNSELLLQHKLDQLEVELQEEMELN
ncbi:proline-rich protein 14 [Aquarana catesbeiana]|uniref:proline-rich protein 14 n=1 Tax=Aquarana catesbeiana TaxID=8400 RepID=UPI003CC93732